MNDIVKQAQQLKVREINREGVDACSITLEIPAGAEEAFRYKPGQFLTLRVLIDDSWHARCYSVCDWDEGSGLLRIGVKQIAGGVVSGWVNRNLSTGDVVWCLPPRGIFTPSRTDSPLVLFAGGSGVTPMLAIAKAALTAGSPDVVLCYANRTDDQVMFRADIDGLIQRFPGKFHVRLWIDDVSGFMSNADVADITSGKDGSEFLVCGPGPYMTMVTQALADAGINHDQVHIEKFQSLERDPFVVEAVHESSSGEQAEITVTLYDETERVAWDKSQNLLVALESAGLSPPFSCREGRCSSCMCHLIEGEVYMMSNNVLEAEDLAEGFILACQSMPVSPTVAVEFE